jgi:hypothetical protein
MHISLDQALGRQPRLNRVGQSLLNIGSGASAAYSLRSLTGGEPKAVRIRRDGDNEERDFTTAEIGNEAADWTNGKQETTLPADVDTAAAAYSLRKVRSAYPGNAVQIRRTSDNVEVNVGFDGSGVVSDTSPITNVTEETSGSSEGSTTATTLGDFLTEDVALSRPPTNAGSGTLEDGTEGSQILTKTGSSTFAFRNFAFITDADKNTLKVSLDIKIPSTNSLTTGVQMFSGTAGQYRFNQQISQRDEFVPVEFELGVGDVETSGGNSLRRLYLAPINSSNNASFVANGESIEFKNVTITYTNNGSTVVTWYDQSGNSNDATQLTAGDQPLIAENGSLVVDGNGNPTISFDVDLANLKVDSFTGGSIAQPYSFFIVAKSKNADANEKIVFSTPSNFIGQSQSSTGRYQIRGGSTSLDGTNVPNTTDQRLFSAFFDSTDELFIDGSASSEISGDGGSSAINDLSIGSQYYLGNPVHDFNGDISEIILYPSSEKSNNRFKIESNINNHYEIYIPAEDGFVNTWFDQSGNSKNATASADADEPEIVKNGNLLTDPEGRPEIQFDGSSHHFNVNFDSDLDQPNTIVMVHQSDTTTLNKNRFFDREGTSDLPRTLFASVNSNYRMLAQSFGDTGVALDTNKTLVVALFNGSSSVLTKNGTAGSLFNSGIQGINQNSEIGISNSPLGNYEGTMQEFIIYNANQSSVQTALETNIANHYGITLS